MSIKVLCVVGARPNFIKIAPLMRSLARRTMFEARLVHTGQHYDARLSDICFRQLAIQKPDVDLGVGPGSQTIQTAEIQSAGTGREGILRAFERALAMAQDAGKKPLPALWDGQAAERVAAVLAEQFAPGQQNIDQGSETRRIA